MSGLVKRTLSFNDPVAIKLQVYIFLMLEAYLNILHLCGLRTR